MSIAVSILETVDDYAKNNSATRVTRVVVEVGALSGVSPEALEMCWAEASLGGVAEKSILDIKRMPSIAKCEECGHEFEPLASIFVCPSCDALGANLISGEQLLISEMVTS